MNFIGVLKKHETGIVKLGTDLTDINRSTTQLKPEEYKRVIFYLENGTVFLSFLHYVVDDLNNPIVPLSFYTDGTWIWPSYLIHYLNIGYYFLLSKDFIDHMKEVNFTPQILAKEKLCDVEKFYANAYNIRSSKK